VQNARAALGVEAAQFSSNEAEFGARYILSIPFLEFIGYALLSGPHGPST
jgi:hypothetical protein